MSRLIWCIRSLATRRGYVSLQKMLKNMRYNEVATVQLGKLGLGIQPNYQVDLHNGVVNSYRGSTHERFGKPFASKNISKPFSLRDIQEAWEIAKREGIA